MRYSQADQPPHSHYHLSCEGEDRVVLLERWAEGDREIIRLGTSTIPSAYILPELLKKPFPQIQTFFQFI